MKLFLKIYVTIYAMAILCIIPLIEYKVEGVWFLLVGSILFTLPLFVIFQFLFVIWTGHFFGEKVGDSKKNRWKKQVG